MVSDPAMLDINGVVIGVSSVDVLFHLAKCEFICQPENTDRMSRFAEHIITQRCFYPLYPSQTSAPGHAPLPVDGQFLNVHGVFDVKPHIMVLPSNLKKFIKVGILQTFFSYFCGYYPPVGFYPPMGNGYYLFVCYGLCEIFISCLVLFRYYMYAFLTCSIFRVMLLI